MSSKRQLAAILFADIQGYTALMQQDEQQASALLRHFQKQMEEKVATHKGRIVNFYGDGALCIFQIPIEAVRCAMDLQKAFRGSLKIPVRIGVHSGTVTVEGDKVFGDSVNITSRIESMSIPGSVLLSKKVRDEVKNNPDLQLQSLGKYEFKNVEESIEVFAVANEGLFVPRPDENPLPKHKKKPLTSNLIIGALILVVAGLFIYSNYFKGDKAGEQLEKSIAVLPFDNITGDLEQQYLCDGLTEELIYRLSMVSSFDKVISRASVMRYQGSELEIPAISEELGVTNVLSGSFSISGNMIRVIASLIDGKTGEIIVPYKYNRPFGDIFDIQSEVANDIVDKLNIDLNDDEKNALNTSPTSNLEAYNLFLKAGQCRASIGWDTICYSFLIQAIELDSSFSSAYAGLASYWYIKGLSDRDIDRSFVMRQVDSLLAKALSLNKDDDIAHLFMANYQLWYNWDFELADYHYKRYAETNPRFAGRATIMPSLFYAAMGRSSIAVDNAEIILRNGIYAPNSYSVLTSYYLDGQVEKSVQLIEKGIQLFGVKPNPVLMHGTGVLNYLGEHERVIELITQAFNGSLEDINPVYICRLAIAYLGTGDKEQAQLYLDRLLALSETTWAGSPTYYASMVLADMGRLDDSFDELQKAYDKREVEMYWLKVEPLFEPLHDDPRWQEMLDKVGFAHRR